MDGDPGDRWGVTMGHRFAIAEALYHHGETIPDEWDFRHGALLPDELDCIRDEYPDAEYYGELQAGDMSADQLRYAGNVLARYAACLRRAGLDY